MAKRTPDLRREFRAGIRQNALFGGCNSMHKNSTDEAPALTAKSMALAEGLLMYRTYAFMLGSVLLGCALLY